MSKVALVKCNTYEYNEVKAAVKKGIDLIGGPSAFANAGEKILLKPNWILAVAPDRAATTHPAVFKAVAEVFKSAGASLSYGDSPAFGSPESAAKKTGCADAANDLGIPLADFGNGKEVTFKEAIQNKKLIIANGVLESDGLISLPKLKTHGFLKLTGSIKNQFGCIPGMLKGEFHVKLPNPSDFAKMLIDINSFIKPRLFIMDGVIGMEGNGPMNGNPVKMGLLMFSSDPVALDATVCRIIGVNPEYSLTVKYGKEAGLGTYSEKEIELVGDPVDSFKNLKFKVDREPIKSLRTGGGIMRLVNGAIVPKPYIVKDKCKKCGVCVKMCPVNPKAVNWLDNNRDNPPTHRYDQCIRCYCCQELCPEGAIEIKKPLVRKLFGKNK
ncbi:MAG TPA: DUF362 domain-containing protein [Clostridia bacterium]|nr:DUF362 domain-containing protein [Clostridia bacterium]